jgi:glucan 1,3-beta-glucosidase
MDKKWRGVNLGGWLVLEKWMTPSLFSGLQAVDEHGLCRELGRDAAEILRIHRDNFITESDFKWIADHGLNAVRIPVGYWIFGREKPYLGGIEYLDEAMIWAEQYGLDVIIDLHGAPGSQNGKAHSGRAGPAEWKTSENRQKTLSILEKLAKRYAGTPSLVGIEVLNEPARHSSLRRLRMFYEQAYGVIRKHCGTEVAVIIPDAFRPRRASRALRSRRFENVLLDIHRYQAEGWRDRLRSYPEHLRRAFGDRRRLIRRAQRSHGVIIGEWSAVLPQKLLNKLNNYQRQLAYKGYVAAQLLGQDDARGWFYWNYKTEKGGAWSYRDAFARGWFPKKFKH